MSELPLRAPERRIQTNPYDVDAWNLLLRESQNRPIDEARSFYESLVKQFPNSGRYWKAYIEHELRSKNFENVEKLFKRCLVTVLNIDLWKCYIHYVHETKGQLTSFREKMAQAYDFALEKVGLDMHSYAIYTEYIAFLKKVPAVGQYAENQRITAVRRVYQRALLTPMHNIDTLWNDYCSYEKSVNNTLAEKLISERNKDYAVSKRVEKQMEIMTRGLNRQAVSVPSRGTATELKQVEMWKKYIAWERGNPMETEEYGSFAKRVVYAYEQALLCLGYYPDIWYEAALFLQEASKKLTDKGDVKLGQFMTQETLQLFERAINGLMKESKLLYYAYADFEEQRMKFDNVKKIYDKIIAIDHIDPTLTYIHNMRFARRVEGVNAARTVFKKAREDKRCGHQVFVAAAIMEYYCGKDKTVAQRVFDYGLKKYGNDSEFDRAYVEFLMHLNEDNNTRVVFERILTSSTLPTEKSTPIWDRYLDFESIVGDLASILKVEQRRKEAYNNGSDVVNNSMLVIDRYKFMNLMPCSSDQLRLIGYTEERLNDSGNFSTPSASKSSTLGPQAASVIMGGGGNVEIAKHGFPRPDISQMIPFKPRVNTSASYHPVPGGVFPPPPAAAHLMQMLPPPSCFMGPFVNVDHLIGTINSYQLPSSFISNGKEKVENGTMLGPMLVEDVKKDFYQLLATTADPNAVVKSSDLANLSKRKRVDSEDDDDSGTASASRDVYKRRMNQRTQD
ncbi:unnamed protein product [Caenorhabditis auriculariae]|uniref:Suppressor of forked domain-containing protein n=1 Tax=Caenorhabditis auriculariae TaxID=2777116 RepID=A0A8S1HFD0_9PELO|nr:unnamed protein product [Caenorhabditis auriculariae]